MKDTAMLEGSVFCRNLPPYPGAEFDTGISS
jgi:hypothetical protein